ncbi:MAG: SseB family protein [Frankiales bacterium]|nr:SseB family protein [Frankiales bacterium]
MSRRLPFAAASDTGEPDPRLVVALQAWSRQPAAAAHAEVLAALAGARIFVAITATSTAEHVEPGTGHAASSAEMALLSLVGSEGGRAVPLFLDAAGPVAFRAGARPVPLPAPEACGAALVDGAVAVLLDPPGAALVVTGAELAELAAGRVAIAGTGLSSRVATGALSTPEQVDDRLLAALGQALRGEGVRAARVLHGPDGLVLGVVADLDPAALTALAARVLPRVRGVLPPGGLDVAVVGAGSPGRVVPLGRGWLRRGR